MRPGDQIANQNRESPSKKKNDILGAYCHHLASDTWHADQVVSISAWLTLVSWLFLKRSFSTDITYSLTDPSKLPTSGRSMHKLIVLTEFPPMSPALPLQRINAMQIQYSSGKKRRGGETQRRWEASSKHSNVSENWWILQQNLAYQ